MKKLSLALSTLLTVALVSASNSSRADGDTIDQDAPKEEVICVTTTIKCANGNGTIYNGCGTVQELSDDYEVIVKYFCKKN